jgi:hypothetical protein
MRFGVVILAALVVCGLLPPALAKNIRWNCVYPGGAKPNGLFKENWKLEFIADDVTAKAVMVGNAGMSDVAMHVGYLGVTFMEMLGGGAVQTTTIAASGASVHSRHTMIGDDKVTPSQYYGQCKLLQ